MKIGILVPSRERIDFKLRLIQSVLDTVSDIDNVNIYFGMDDDDPTRNDAMWVCRGFPFVKFVPVHNEGKFIGINRIWNILAANCLDQIFECLGDDSIFRTKGWDRMILDEFSEANCPKDRFKLVHCWDGHYGEQLCINHFVDRIYYETLGHFCRPEFLIGWSDQWTWQMFKAFGRITYRKDIFIEHVHFNNGGRGIDNVNMRMHQADRVGGRSIIDSMWHNLVDRRIEDVEKIAKYLNMKPDWKYVDRKGRI
jgi:hypothetical protein